VIFVIIRDANGMRSKPVTLIVKACPELDEGCFWFNMSHAKNPEEMFCATCPMRKKAEEKPKSLMSRWP